MELFKIACGIVAVVTLGYFYHRAVKQINANSFANYGYAPVTWRGTGIMLVPYVAIISGIMLGGSDNLIVGVFIALLCVVWYETVISRKTSWQVAVGAICLMLVRALFIIVCVCLLFLLFSSREEKKK